MLGIATEAEVYNGGGGDMKGSTHGISLHGHIPYHQASCQQITMKVWNISITAYPNLSMTNSRKWHKKEKIQTAEYTMKNKIDMNSAFQ